MSGTSVVTPEDNLTVSSGWIRAMLDGASQLGLNSDELAQQANIEVEDLMNPDKRISLDNTLALWRLIETQGPSPVGILLGQTLTPAHFPLLAFNLIHSQSVSEALQAVSRYTDIISEGGGFEFHIDAELVSIYYHANADDFSYHQIDAVLLLLKRTVNWLVYRDVPLVSVSVRADSLTTADIARYRAAFAAPINFGQQDTHIVYHLKDIMVPLPGSDPELAEMHHSLLERKLARIQLPKIVQDVQQLLRHLSSLDIERTALAGQLALSPRTLQRKLHAAGTSFQQLLDNERQRRAVDLLLNSNQTIDEISLALGFSESGAFSRAFKRWQGLSPKQFRSSR